MNTIFKYTLLLAILLLAACTKQPGGQGEPIPMAVEVALDGTKAGVTTADLTDFYLQVSCSDAAYSYFVHVTKATSGSWLPDQPMFWRDETTPVTYCGAVASAHAFTQDEFANGVDLSVPAAQTDATVLSANDLLLVQPATTKFTDTAGGKLTLELTHALSILRFELTLGEKFYDCAIGLTDSPVSNLTLDSMPLTYHFTPSAGTVTPVAGSEADITPYASSYTPGTATAKAAKAVYEALVVPGAYAAGALTLSFKIGNGVYTWTNNKPVVFTSGQSATLPISVSTAPPTTIHGHEYVDMGEVTIGTETKHLYWATCNIGADNPWDYGDYFDWGGIKPYYQAGHSQDSPCSDWIDGKDGYNWKNYSFMQAGQSDWKHITKYTFADGHTDGTLWYDGEGNFIGDGKTSFADYNYADDAARQLWGGTWRIPTDEEWTALRDETYYTWEWTADYLGDGSNHAGRIVTRKTGTGPCAGNSIFLPAAGYRGYTGPGLSSAGSGGYYWSSSLFETYSDYAREVVFYSDGVYRNRVTRDLGQSLRPVAD